MPKDFAAMALTMLKGGANILHSRSACYAPWHGLSVKPQWAICAYADWG